MKEIDRSQVTIGKADKKNPLGKGAFAVVYKASWQQAPDHDGVVTIRTVAIKELQLGRDRDCWRFEHEAKILSACKHPNIINIFGFISSLPCQMVLEYLSQGSVVDALSNSGFGISWERRQRWVMHIGWALDYLHRMTRPIIHRDVKLDNVLISDADHAKLADFGLSGVASLFQGKIVGTPGYMAPEIVASGSYSIGSDNYAYALVVWELLCCQLIRVNQRECLISEELKQSILFEIPSYVPLSIAGSIISCLDPNPLQPSATALALATEFKMHERELLQADKRFNTVLFDARKIAEVKQLFQQYHVTEFQENFFVGLSNTIILYSLLTIGNPLFFKKLMVVAGDVTDYSALSRHELLTLRDQYAADYQSTCLRCFGITSKELNACVGQVLQHFKSVTIESVFNSARKVSSSAENKEQIAIFFENIMGHLLSGAQTESWITQATTLSADVCIQKMIAIKQAIEGNPALLKAAVIPVFASKNSAVIKNFIAQLDGLALEDSAAHRQPLRRLQCIYYFQQFISTLKANDSVRTLDFVNGLIQEHLLSDAASHSAVSASVIS